MIIKKKYANIAKKNDDLNKEVIPEIEDFSTDEADVDFQLKEDVDNKENDLNITESEVENNEPKPFSLDLSVDDIEFEQRPERREGSRRRGYRRTQDRNIVSRAQKEAQTIKEAAKQDGYKDGINQASSDLAELKAKLIEFYNYKELVFQKVSECILDISVEIAKKIINKQIETDNDALISIIKAAIGEVNKTEEKLTLKVMPKDVELVRDKLPEIFSENSFEAKILVVPDINIREGGVIIETSNGIIDATIETQLEIVENALKTQTEEER